MLKFGLIVSLLGISLWSGMASAQRGEPHPDTDEVYDLALRNLQRLGADVEGAREDSCSSCHSLSLYGLRNWARAAMMKNWFCLYEDEENPRPALDRINCLRSDPTDPASPFAPHSMGLLTAGAHHEQFQTLFREAYPDTWREEHARFAADVAMPPNGREGLSSTEFDELKTWVFEHDAQYLEKIVGQPEDPPRECVAETTPELVNHIEAMSFGGWEARNREEGLEMFACEPGKSPLACFASEHFVNANDTPDKKHWDDGFPLARTKIVADLPFATTYWMRVSPDGRFVGNGFEREDGGRRPRPGDPRDGGRTDQDENFGGRITDLAPLTAGSPARHIKVMAYYDPSFFPDNSAFLFQGDATGICPMAILEDPTIDEIDFDETNCSLTPMGVGLYQAVGASLDGGDYVAVTGEFESDSGNGWGRESPYWMEVAYTQLVPIINDGTRFVPQPAESLYTPYVGDLNISPSNGLLSARIAGLDRNDQPKQMGYEFFRTESDETGEVPFKLKSLGRFCKEGGKGKFSFNERFFVYFHYVTASDYAELGFESPDHEDFRKLIGASSNIYLHDILTGETRLITKMGAEEFAQFPSFRSDGWIYFMVYNRVTGKRTIAVNDGKIVVETL